MTERTTLEIAGETATTVVVGSGLLGEKTEILGWYADKEQIRREIESIRLAMSRGERTYQLQFYTKVEYRGVLGQPHIVE